jgi:HK97 family phage major capsid protein
MTTTALSPTEQINVIVAAAQADGDRDLTEQERQLIATLEAAEQRHTPPRRSKPDAFGTPGRRVLRNTGKTYGAMFGRETLSQDGWESFDAYLEAVHSGLHHERLRPGYTAGMTEGTPSAGGYMVPEQYVARMLDKSLESEIVRPRCQVEPMTTETKTIAGFNDADHSSGSLFGGFTVQWLKEGGTGTNQAPKFRKIKLEAKKLCIFTLASNELVADGMSFEQMLGEALTGACGWGLDYAALRGSGQGEPLGMLSDPALITVSKETDQPAATIVYENVVKMFARIHPACVGNSVWVANPATIPQLMMLSIPIGVGGTHVPVLQQSGNSFSMLTRPVLFTEKMPTLGTKGDLSLCDFSQYTIGLREGAAIDKSQHVGWQTDETGYRLIMRVDGQGRWKSAFTPANGSTLSWCVTLETRS